MTRGGNENVPGLRIVSPEDPKSGKPDARPYKKDDKVWYRGSVWHVKVCEPKGESFELTLHQRGTRQVLEHVLPTEVRPV